MGEDGRVGPLEHVEDILAVFVREPDAFHISGEDALSQHVMVKLGRDNIM